MLIPHLLVERAGIVGEAFGIDAVSDLGRSPAEFGHDAGLPEVAHDEQFVGLGDRARLPIAEAGILEAVDMVHGARKAPDQAALLQVASALPEIESCA